MKRNLRSGLTLLELATVMVILAALAGMVIPVVNDRGNEARTTATLSSMKQLRDVILGDYSNHMDGKLPRPKTITSIRLDFPQLRYLFINPEKETSEQTYNPSSGRGWRGPYVVWNRQLYKVTDGTNTPPSGPFTTLYGIGDGDDNDGNVATKSDPTVLDGWGNPIILREYIIGAKTYAELRSAGRNELLDLSDTNAYDGDDLVLPVIHHHF